MSSSTLDPDSIAALFAAAGDGNLPEEGATDGRAAPSVRTVDFRRPRQFTNETQRRLRRALETFCRTASSRLSAELRAVVDLEIISVEQLNWSDAHGQMPATSMACVLTADPIGTKLLLSAERPLLVAAIERMLGGSGEDPPPQRRLSDIDTVLASQLFETLVNQLSIIWHELVGATLEMDELNAPQHSAQLATTSEPTLAFTIEAKLFRGSSALVLLVPYRSIAPVAERLNAVEGHDPTADERSLGAMQRGLRRVEVEIRVEVGAVELPIERVLSLVPGDVVGLETPSSSGVLLWVDDTPLERGRPGRSGARRAVQVVGPVQAGR